MIDRLSSNNYSLSQKTTDVVDERKVNPAETIIDNTKRELEKKVVDAPVSKERLEEIVQSMNKFLQPTHTSLKFEFHEKLNEYYVKIVDDKTRETVREIPSKKLLDMYAAMTEFLGLIVDKKI